MTVVKIEMFHLCNILDVWGDDFGKTAGKCDVWEVSGIKFRKFKILND